MPTRSLLEERLGRQEPVVHHPPPDVVSLAAAEDAIELADAYGVCDGFPLAESQKITLRGALAERQDGSWAATRVGDFGPRQGTGKNDKIAARELAGLILFGEKLIIHTAHEFPTANESFLRLVAVFENWDDLRKRVDRIRYANGEQGIELKSGQRLKYKARTGGGGRGFAKADLVVYDEAQHLQAEHVAASGPAKLANPNSQTWYAGSGGLPTSGVAWALRRAAVMGEGGRLAYTEATAETVTATDGVLRTSAPDPADLDAWYRAMPGLGRWVTEESMRALYDELGPDLFARECLCVWDAEPGTGASLIPLEDWADCTDSMSSALDPVCFTFDVSPGREKSSIGVCGGRPDGVSHIEVVENLPGTEWVPARMAALKASHRPALIGCDPAGPAGSLLPALEALGIKVQVGPDKKPAPGSLVLFDGAQHAKACGLIKDSVIGRKVRHLGDSRLSAALAGAVDRPLGDAWAWSRRKSDVDITPLVAVTLALWLHSQVQPPRARVLSMAAVLAAAGK